MGGNRMSLLSLLRLLTINPRDGGNSNCDIFAKCKADINPRDGGAIDIRIYAKRRNGISIPAMGGNSRIVGEMDGRSGINPRNGGQ